MKKIIYLFVGVLLLNSCAKAPEACFNYLPTTISAGDIVTFNPNCSKNASYFKWNFGDNSSDTITTNSNLVNHVYKTSGNFTVKLIANRKDGVTLRNRKPETSLIIVVQ